MAITRDTVFKIASLARIAITAVEAERFERELSKILDFIAELEKLDTSTVAPLAGGVELESVMRDDEPRGGLPNNARDLISAAPTTRDGFIEVAAVFDRTSR